MAKSENDASHVVQSLIVNFAIACVKGVASFLTGSGAMLAETIHSLADCGNQLLLLLGMRRSMKAPTEKFPLGFGRELYFWSFMVAVLLFTGGGVFSVYEGVHKFHHPEPLEWVFVGSCILFFSLVLEGYATISNIKEINRRRGRLSFLGYLREATDSDLVVVFGENLADTLGLLIALPALLLAWVTGDPMWDGLGTLLIGLVLIAVALFLAVEVKSLLLGERADKRIEDAARDVAVGNPAVTHVLHYLALQQGPGQVLLLMKLAFQNGLGVEEVATVINTIEDQLRERCPEVVWSFIEPDIPR